MGTHVGFQPNLTARVGAATGRQGLRQSSGAAEILMPIRAARGCIGRPGDHGMGWEAHLLQPGRGILIRLQQLLGIVSAPIEALLQHMQTPIQIYKQK
jgi:hypothetical protein